ncbi:MAG: glycosyltransferase family 4 protein [Planctomycetota bacterium]
MSNSRLERWVAPANHQRPVQEAACDILEVHAVVLINYLRPHHVVALQELAKRIRKLSVLVSVPMEADRDWHPEWADLDVTIQKNYTICRQWNHSSGFSENNFIHVPADTISQLKRLQPDIIFSYEMGFRTLLSCWYRVFHRNTRLVMVGNMSDHIEAERGISRRCLRWIIKKGVDFFTYNGPACRRYLESLKIPAQKMFHIPYCIDPQVVSTREKSTPHEDVKHLLYCGALSSRKAMVPFVSELNKWCRHNTGKSVVLTIAGSGPSESELRSLRTDNLEIRFLGNCSTNQIKACFHLADFCVYPTLADEWGLVPIEAMASGVPILGSKYAQSVETHVVPNVNGWQFDPLKSESIFNAIDDALHISEADWIGKSKASRDSVANISAATTAEKFCNLIRQTVSEESDCVKPSMNHQSSEIPTRYFN